MGDEKVRLRRYKDDLYVSGQGILVMGIWSAIKFIMQIFLMPNDDLKPDTDDPMLRVVYMAVVIILVAIIMLIILRLHFYISLNAIRAAKGKRYKKGYYFAAIIFLALTVLSMTGYKDMFKKPENIDTTIASMLVDLTTIYIFVIVIISTNKIKTLKTKAQEV